MQGNYEVFRPCARYAAYFCSKCYDLGESFIKILNEHTDKFWFFPSCSKPALSVVLVEKDTEECWQLFFDTIEKQIAKIE